ncbi:sensor histidine kinase [Paenibacillus spongiae]|uniref:histidine kinase n=1 Tax=Paenibacillus spongiae TaxID=2909671 RepID=A0ABY5S5D9_9BACL|nr:sensor histidine kinase [Paenibacillus spongiae]UVI28790.1 sensor histidine kinase [Paenibacillus spongiae]
MKFRYKLLLSYLLLVITPIIAIGYFAYTSSVQYVKEQTRQNVVGTLKQAHDNVMEKMKVIERVDNQIYLDQSLQQLLHKTYSPYESYQITKESLTPKLDSVLNLASNDMLLDIFVLNSTLPEIYYTKPGDVSPIIGKRFELYRIDRIVNENWYLQFMLAKEQSLWRQVDRDVKYGNVSLLQKLMHFQTVSTIGIMRIAVSMSDLFGDLDYNRNEQDTPKFWVVNDSEGNRIYESSQNPIPEDWQTHPDRYLLEQQPLEGMNWNLAVLVPLQELEKGAHKVRNLTFFICLASFGLLAVISTAVSNYFSKHIKRIVFSLHSFKEGRFSKRIPYSGRDEFAQISIAFNEMAQNIEELIQEVYVGNLRKKEAELEALQAQIKPHFLYNTLSSISRLSRLGETEKLHQMVNGLAAFYRLTLNQGKSMIPIHKEVEQVQAYIDIQKIKQMDRLEVSCDIPFPLLNYDTPKLILQPFVENALEHAMFGDKLHIRILAQQEGSNIVFKIIDNGIGMSKERLREVGDRAEAGYGIRNVDERIRLQFGEAFGVSLHSGLGIGTTVKIVIPAYRES